MGRLPSCVNAQAEAGGGGSRLRPERVMLARLRGGEGGARGQEAMEGGGQGLGAVQSKAACSAQTGEGGSRGRAPTPSEVEEDRAVPGIQGALGCEAGRGRRF